MISVGLAFQLFLFHRSKAKQGWGLTLVTTGQEQFFFCLARNNIRTISGAMLFFFWITFEYSVKAWVRWELTMDSALMAPLAPMRTAMPVGVGLLMLQGIAEILRAIHILTPSIKRLISRLMPVYSESRVNNGLWSPCFDSGEMRCGETLASEA